MWHGGLKAGWITEMLDAQNEIGRGVSTINLPFITIHGTSDTLVDISSSQFLYDNAQSEDKTFEVSIHVCVCLCVCICVYVCLSVCVSVCTWESKATKQCYQQISLSCRVFDKTFNICQIGSVQAITEPIYF